MLIDYEPQSSPPRCQHKYTFWCWYRDPITRGEDTTHDFRHMVERCRRCGVARVSSWFDNIKMRGYSYAENIEEAVLGEPYTLKVAPTTAKVAAN